MYVHHPKSRLLPSPFTPSEPSPSPTSLSLWKSPYCCLCQCVVFKGLNLLVSLVFKGTPFSYCVFLKAILNSFRPETTVVLSLEPLHVSAVLTNYLEEHSEAETKSSVTLIKPCGHHGWLPVYGCIPLSFTGSVVLAQ